MPQRGVDRVPAEALDRDLVGAQHAGVEEAEQLDGAEVALAQRAELLGAVLLDVPRVAGALLALGRERQHVGRRDVGDPVAPDQRRGCGRAPRRGPGRARSSAGTRRSRRRRPTARSWCARSCSRGPEYLQAGVLEGVGVGVDADDRRRRCGRARRSRSPRRTRGRRRAGRRPARRSTRRRRGGAGTSSSPPARRGACARRSAGGAGRPGAGRAGGRARARRARTLAARARRPVELREGARKRRASGTCRPAPCNGRTCPPSRPWRSRSRSPYPGRACAS